MMKNIIRSEIIIINTGKYRGAAYNICNEIQKRRRYSCSILPLWFCIRLSFHNKRACIEQFECLGENTYKYKTFLVSIKKEFDNGKTITYRIKLVYSFRFMSSSLLYLADNVSERLHNCKYTDCKSCLEYISTKNEILIFNCLKCSKSHESILIKISLKDLQTHMNCAMETLINLFCYSEKEFIHTSK